MNFKEYFKVRAARKRLLALANHASTVRKMQSDLVSEQDNLALREEIRRVRAVAKRSVCREEIEEASRKLSEAIGEKSVWKPLHANIWAENFEVIVVAVAVAMAFRCYFFQPFKIPTGSMQPTLYGIHTEAHQDPGFWDHIPMKYLKWIVTGDWYTEIRVKKGGMVYPVDHTIKPGYVSFRISGELYHVPSEAVVKNGYYDPSALRDVSQYTGRIKDNGLLWSGTKKSGDHVFVNRMTWNFRRPRRGDVMVFSTTGIPDLPQGTYYIKRMSGMPGEKISISPPNLLIDGKPVEEPETMARIARKEQITPGAPPYSGYMLVNPGYQKRSDTAVQLRSKKDVVALSNKPGEREYYALGDNTANSLDSRFWGPVPERQLLGVGSFIYWPFSRIQVIR